MSLITEEHRIIKMLIKKLRPQHKTTLMFKRLQYLNSAIRTNKNVCICAENLYLACTSNLVMNHFVQLSLVVLGLASRIWYLSKKKH